MRFAAFIFLMCFWSLGFTQSFDYEVTTDSRDFNIFFNGTKLNNAIWDDPTFQFTAPFPITIMGKVYSHVQFASEGTGGSLQFSNSDGEKVYLALSILDLADRGLANPPKSKSSIRHKTTGSLGNRILTLQYYNCGFFDPINDLGDGSDFIHMQVKFYEVDHAIEFCYGDRFLPNYSRITANTQGNTIAFFKAFDDNFYPDSVWYLKNNPAVPEIQFIRNGQSFPFLWQEEPARNTFIRFMPINVANKNHELNFSDHYAAYQMDDQLHISRTIDFESVSISLFGMDGSNPINRTFINGKSFSIPISTLTSGVYILSMSGEDGIATKKVYLNIR